MYKENIKIAFINSNNDAMADFWKKLKEYLNKKYNLHVNIIDKNETVYPRLIEDIHNDKYDLAIGDFVISQKYYSKVSFPFPFFYMSPMIAFIPDNRNSINYLLYIRYLLKGWSIPLTVLLIMGLFWGFIIYKIDGKRTVSSGIFHTISAFLGETSNLVSNTNKKNILSIFISIIVLVFVFLFTIYFNSITVVRSISYFSDSSKLKNQVKGMRIFISLIIPGGIQAYNSLKNHGAIPVLIKDKNITEVNDLIQYYLQNKDKADGIVLTGFRITEKTKNKDLVLSNFFLNSSLPISIPINKKRNRLLNDINNFILKNKDNGGFMDICEKSILPDDSMSAYC